MNNEENLQKMNSNLFDEASIDLSHTLKTSNQESKPKDDILFKEDDIEHSLNDIEFSSRAFINAIIFRDNLNDTIHAGNSITDSKNIEEIDIEEKYGSFKERIQSIHENVSSILEDQYLSTEDKKNATELQSVLENVIDHINDDNTRNFHIVELMQKYTKEINKEVQERDEDSDLVERADRRKEDILRIEEKRKKLEEELEVNSSDNYFLQKGQYYFGLSEKLDNTDFKLELLYYKSRKNLDPGMIIAQIDLNPHIYGNNVKVEDVVKKQVSLNKEIIKNSGLRARFGNYMDLEVDATRYLFRQNIMVNPLLLPVKGLVLALDATDELRMNASTKIKKNNLLLKANLLHEAGMYLGKQAVMKNIRDLNNSEMTESKKAQIKKQLTNSFNSIGNQSFVNIKSIYNDAQNGKISPIIRKKIEEVSEKTKNLADDLNPKNIRERRKLRPN